MKKLGVILIFFFSCSLFAQQVVGTVINQNGDPLPFAFVKLFQNAKEPSIYCTDSEGHFIFKNGVDFKNKKLFARFSFCISDTQIFSSNKVNEIKVMVFVTDSCWAKIEISDCRFNIL